jgi:hypothetical protein
MLNTYGPGTALDTFTDDCGNFAVQLQEELLGKSTYEQQKEAMQKNRVTRRKNAKRLKQSKAKKEDDPLEPIEPDTTFHQRARTQTDVAPVTRPKPKNSFCFSGQSKSIFGCF